MVNPLFVLPYILVQFIYVASFTFASNIFRFLTRVGNLFSDAINFTSGFVLYNPSSAIA
jgi:hypothetical protein